jgi:fibronectin-binding autotransporter adhesin
MFRFFAKSKAICQFGLAGCLSILLLQSSPAATFTWNGGGSDSNWSTAANWAGNAVPANDGTAAIVLAGTTGLSPNVDVAWDISSLTFSINAGAFVVGGAGLTLRAGGIVSSSANSQTINNAITMAAAQTWSATSGNLILSGNINNGGDLLTIAGNFNSVIGGVISGAGGLTKTGTGTNILSGTNTYSGVTTVSVGVMNIQNSSALGSTNAGTIVASSAVLQLQGGISVGSEPLTLSGSGLLNTGALRGLAGDNSWSGVITLAAASTISCDANSLTLGAGGIVNSTFLLTITDVGNVSVTGSIGNGTGGLTKAGIGTLTLSGTNSYGGLTTVSAGVLNVQNNSALGSTALGTTVASGATLQLQGGFDVTGEALSLSGTGVGGNGALRNLNSSNSWSGTITLAGVSTVNADAGTLYIGANVVNATFLATFTNNGTILLAGALGSGTGGLTKTGTGTLVVNGTNNYTGATTVSGGVLQFGATGDLPVASAITVNVGSTLDLNGLNESILSLAGAGNVTLGSGTLTVNNTAAATFSGVMSGTGGLTKFGVGIFTMSGVNTYVGGTTINGGAISIAAATGIGNATNALTLNGGTLTTTGVALTSARAITLGSSGGVFNVGGTTLTLSGAISGPGALSKLGTKILLLTGTNTYLGGTTNGAGTITISSDSELGDPAGAIIFSAASTLTTTASFSSARNVFLNAGTASFSAGAGFTNTLSGVISGAGALTKAGTGVLLLSGNNTYTNTTTISAGTLRLGGNERLSDLTPVNITAAAATFDVNSFTETIGSLASSAAGNVTLGSGSLTAGGNNTSTTLSAVISGTGSFTKAGTGTLTLSGSQTYTGTTTISGGTLQISVSERIANTSPVVVGSGAVFNMNNFSETIGSLAGAGSVTLGTGTLTAGNASAATFSGSISGTGAFVKVGAGTQTFSGTNTYNGATTISVGNLQVNGSAASSAAGIASGATLSGNGTVGSAAVNLGSTVAPGAAGPGTLTSGLQTWAGAGNYKWEINNATGAKGGDPGWSWMNMAGALTINASSGSKFVIKVVSLNSSDVAGQAANFDNTATYVWTIASASGGIIGFDPAKFTIDTSAFQNALGAGAFSVSQNGNDLNLIFTTAAPAAVKGVQSGTLTSSGNGTNTATLTTAVIPTNAFLIFNTRHNSGVPGGSMVRGRIASSNSVEFVRVTTETSTMNIQWYVVEYSAGVRVQRGEVNQTNTVINVPLAAIAATNQAFVTWSKTPDSTETAFTDSDPVIGEITTTSNLQFRVGSAPYSAPVISWQVIEFSHPASINVQRGSVTNMTGTNTLATVTLTSPVDTNSTFLLTGYRTSGAGASVGARMLRAQLSDASTLTFDRGISGAPDNISEILWQAVQLKDGSVMQRGTVSFPSGVAQTNVVLISLNTNHAAAFANVQPVGGQNTGRSPSTNGVLGVGSATLAVASSSQLTLDRNNTADQADVGWVVAGFGPGSLLTPATGGSGISANAQGGTYTNLTGPVYTEIQSGNVAAGTIILNAPAGFVFDTGGTAPTVLVTRVAGSGANALNINGVASGTSVAMTAITTSNLTFTITSASSGGVTCSLTWQNLRVRPSAGTPLASGNLTSSGTAVIQGITTNATSWGFLAEIVGAATKLAFQTAPSSTAVAGVEFVQQPVLQVQDQFGNVRSGDNSTVVTAAINTGTGVLQGSATATTLGGVAAFSGLSYQVAETIKLGFTSTGLIGVTSGNIVVSPAPASRLTIQTQPSTTATAGVVFPQQPVVRVEDQFGNLRSADSSTVVTASLNEGSGTLLGTLTATAANGVATFVNLSYQVAETITIDFTSGALAPETSANVVVNPAAASQLVIQTQPSPSATAGSPFAQQPAVQIQDQFGNLRSADNSTVITASRNAGSGSGALQGTLTATASGGIGTFINLAHNVAGSISIDFSSGILAAATSSGIQISPAAIARLAFATQPGSATVGSTFGVQPVLVTQDTYGNGSSSGLGSSLNVALALTSGAGSLQGTATLDIGLSAGNGTVAFTGLRIDSAGSKQLTASASGLTSAVSASFSVAQDSQTISFASLAGKTYGNAPFSVSASASSGLPITFSIVSGPASVSSSTVSITGAGPVTVRATQPGSADYTAATPVDQSFTVAQAALTVTADSKTRVFGATNPVLTASYNGFVNGDNSSSLTGSPSLSTTAANGSSVAGSPYSIVATNGTLSATNYTFSFTNGQLTITQASTTNAVSSSANPSPTGSNVTFAAAVTAVLPGSGTPTGTVQFLADGALLGSPAALTGGTGSISSSTLSHGTHTITARYAGDGNFFGSTNNLSPNEVINAAPVAANDNLQRYQTSGVKVRAVTLLANDTDPENDALTFNSAGPASSAGGTVAVNNGWVFYTPPAGFTNSDSYLYSISDAGGLYATGSVAITIPIDLAPSQNVVAIQPLSNGAALIQFQGIAGRAYTIQYTASLQTPAWHSLGTGTADASGRFQFTDPSATGRFYRSTYP